ncbi:MAG: 30S ribosomal protein S4 [Chloroflexi bacterium]|nr:MAG: 30S ribosomal protein S4 [Chloroflexota bacterium]TMG02952.1 MAG: 30S ribosomal protein S4 [Chloroflexota bacterium]
MARYTGPVCRLCRRLGDKLYLKGEKCFTPKCPFEKRPYPPGQRSTRRRKVSDRGLQLREKQRARAIYGILERQFNKYYEIAAKRHGVTGETLLRTLELRLDNVAYRLGFADSRQQARQLVLHGHIAVNGRKSSIPSHVLKPNDVISLTGRGKKSEYFKIVSEQIASKSIPSWLSLDAGNLTGRVLALPEVAEIGPKFNVATIVEYYSR